MIQAIKAIEEYVVPSYEEFLADEKTGEAANKISEEFQDQHPEIPWSSIIGTRNVIVHGYDQVKLPIVWDIIRKDLAALQQNLQKIIK